MTFFLNSVLDILDVLYFIFLSWIQYLSKLQLHAVHLSPKVILPSYNNLFPDVLVHGLHFGTPALMQLNNDTKTHPQMHWYMDPEGNQNLIGEAIKTKEKNYRSDAVAKVQRGAVDYLESGGKKLGGQAGG
jgi:hypothetical protein